MSEALAGTIARIGPADSLAAAEAQRSFDQKTKPRGSLGRLETLAAQIAGIRGDSGTDPLRAAIVVAAADHGVVQEGVSAYPADVTREMLANFRAGGAAVCVLARQARAELHVIDAGVGSGTANIAEGPAMTRDEALERVGRGIDLACALADDGIGVVALGEMGIGNTTVASSLAAALLPADAAAVCGRGTGLDDAGVARKVTVVRRALSMNAVDRADPLGALAALGGFEVAVLTGVALEAAARRMVVLLDGFITGAAALVAVALAPQARDSMIAAHLSPEPGHRLALEALGLKPLLDLDLRLGEGTGAALSLPLVHASRALLAEMATFESAGVTDAGR
jgi:nicotinate-nucleotide--dimethylbenzimidazole phosphoribosyltransferase